MSRTKSGAKRRINLEVSPEVRARLERLQQTEESTLTDVFRRALKLYETYVDETRAGNKIIIMRPDGNGERLVIL